MKALAVLLMASSISLFSHTSFAKGTYLIPMDATTSDIDFGEVYVGDYTYEEVYVHANDKPLALTNIAITGDMFAMAHNCPASLDAGKDCHIFVIFEPTAEGDYTGNLTVNTDGGDYIFNLTGSGYADDDGGGGDDGN